MPNNARLLLQIFAGGLAFVACSALIFWPLEEIFEGEKSTRPKFKDIVQTLVLPVVWTLDCRRNCFSDRLLIRQAMPSEWLAFVHEVPFWLRATVALLLAETCVYLAPRGNDKN